MISTLLRLGLLVDRIDRKEVLLDPAECLAADDPHSVVDFHVDGWLIRVFNDGGDFDYIDSAVSPEGSLLDFKEIYEADIYPLHPEFWWETKR